MKKIKKIDIALKINLCYNEKAVDIKWRKFKIYLQ